MTLFLIILIFIFLGLIIKSYQKSYNIIITLTILCVIFSYFIFAKNFPEHSFFPQKYQYTKDCRYNRLIYSLKKYKLDIEDDIPKILEEPNIHTTFVSYLQNHKTLFKFYDLSCYKGKIYLYWGLTPVLMFYLPFNLITNLYLSDNMVVWLLTSFIFLLSLLILRKSVYISIPLDKSTNINFLFFYSSLIIGYCNYSIFLVTRPSICEVAISCAAFLLLLSIYLFIEFLDGNKKHTNILPFFIGLFLSLSVGCRPHYILFIPIFYIFIVYVHYTRTKNIKDILKISGFFILPCIIYAIILALYNYLRFDSIFEFGLKLQLNNLQLYNYTPTFTDFIVGLKNHLLKIPDINPLNYTIFSLRNASGHRIGNELISGIIYIYPMSMILILIPLFYFIKRNKITTQIVTLFSLLFVITFFMACLFGMIQRFVFEYMYILVILTLFVFIIFYNYISSKYKLLILIFFIIITTYTIYVNLSLLLCFNNLMIFVRLESLKFYENLINLLFNAGINFNIMV